MQSAVYSMNTGISSTKKMIALYFSNIFYDTMSDFSPRTNSFLFLTTALKNLTTNPYYYKGIN